MWITSRYVILSRAFCKEKKIDSCWNIQEIKLALDCFILFNQWKIRIILFLVSWKEWNCSWILSIKGHKGFGSNEYVLHKRRPWSALLFCTVSLAAALESYYKRSLLCQFVSLVVTVTWLQQFTSKSNIWSLLVHSQKCNLDLNRIYGCQVSLILGQSLSGQIERLNYVSCSSKIPMIRHIFVSILWQRPPKPYKLFKIFFNFLLKFKIRHASTTCKEIELIRKSLGISQKSWKKSRDYMVWEDAVSKLQTKSQSN